MKLESIWTHPSIQFAAFVLAIGCSGDDGGDGNASATEPGVNATDGDDGDGDGDGDDGGDDGGGDGDDSDGGVPGSCDDAPLTQWEQMMLDSHNTWRGSVDPPAANMLRVYWDKGIAGNAADWVSSCDPDWPHSSEESRSNIGGYDVLGENLSYCAGTGCSPLPQVTDGSGLGDGEGWWDERHDYTWEDDSSSDITSHYTQLASSNVYAIGCATQQCDAPGPYDWDGDWWWTICQYGPRGHAYWSGTKPYDTGEGGLIDPPAEVWNQHPLLCGGPE